MDNQDEVFAREFKRLTDNEPYPWQRRLYEQLSAGAELHGLDIPTGLGKTSILPIWLLAHLHAAPQHRPPMRLVYVVNRRTIVDQATEAAIKLQAAVGKDKLAVSTLRGALADNGDWLLHPHRPAIIVGTVDMIGSRLLFNAYRAGRWQRSRHAGLLGQDSLIVHDEAHMSEPFQQLLKWIADRQAVDGSPRPMRVLAMSATSSNGQSRDNLTLTDEDRRLDAVRIRLYAAKQLVMHPPVAKNAAGLAAHLAELAFAHHQAQARVIVYVQTPDLAKAVVEAIRALYKKAQRELPNDRIELLTGTIRGSERDDLINRPVLQHLLTSEPPDQTEYLVSTSAGEVGADFDATHMVCDLAPIDSFIQRAGRVNRRGRPDPARIDLVLNVKDGAKLTPHEAATDCAGRLLKQLPLTDSGEGLDASPQSLRNLKEQHPEEYAAAVTPQPRRILPHEATLDAWSLTSLQEDWPLAQEVAPYLHGLDDEDPQTLVAWRAELDELDAAADIDLARVAAQTILAHYPLRARELLRDRPDRVAELLIALRERRPEISMILHSGRRVELMLLRDLKDDQKSIAQQLSFRTIILPASAGGLSLRGMLDRKEPAPAPDVADRGEKERDRARVLLKRNGEGNWRAKVLPEQPRDEDAEPAPEYQSWTEARDALARQLRMRYAARIVLHQDEVGTDEMLLVFRERSAKADQGVLLPLAGHSKDVHDRVKACVDALRLNLGPAATQALLFAGHCHDLGKAWKVADGRWQRAINGHDGKTDLAKSLGNGMNTRLLAGYRHEFGSLVEAVTLAELEALDEAARDLALHLIAAHHGRGRPDFTAAAIAPVRGSLDARLEPDEIARRFDRMQRRYGHWGLAWLEAILMAADAEASQSHNVPSGEDEEVEENNP